MMRQTEGEQTAPAPSWDLHKGYSCSELGPRRVYYAEGNTLFGFVALPHKMEHN